MSLYFVLESSSIRVQGKTYPYRDRMRALGATYNSSDKTWAVPNNPQNMALIEELCRSVGGGAVKEAALSKTSVSVAMPTSLASFKTPSLAAEESVDALAPLKPELDGFSIADLMQKAQLALTQTFPRSVWVIGEIQNIKQHRTGVYFQLADSKEGGSQTATMTVSATIWQSNLRELTRKFGDALNDVLQDGFRVRVLCDVTLYKDRGQLTLQIQSIDPNFTKGSLALQREKLLKELRAKGLHLQNKSLRLPAFPLRIGLLSADDSRAKSDFLDQLLVYGFPGEVVFKNCQMQGEATLRDVVQGLQFLQEASVDLIVMTRGGGSAADLRWFDSPEIAYAIAGSKVPVIAAIGHHEDTCVAEEICFHREKTPTAAADYVISLFQKTRERLDQIALYLDKSLTERVKLFEARMQGSMEKMRAAATGQLNDQRRFLDQSESGLELNWHRRLLALGARLDQAITLINNRALTVLERRQNLLKDVKNDLQRRSQDKLREQEFALQKLESVLKQKDPAPWMAQGWTQLFGDKGLIKSSEQVEPGEGIRARLKDSVLKLRITEIEKAQGAKK